MTTAFVLWGIGSLGAAQVGQLRSLTAAGLRPDFVVGASVGALNAVYYAAHPEPDGVDEMARLWLDLGRHDVFPLGLVEALNVLAADVTRPVRGLLRAFGLTNHVFPLNPATLVPGIAGWNDHVIGSGRFERFLTRVLPVDRLEQTSIPVHVVATDVLNGQAVDLTSGPAVPALLASTALPGVYPPVDLEGRVLADGGMASRTTLDLAVELGADEVYLVTPGYDCRLPERPSSALAMAIHAFNLLDEQRWAASIANVDAGVKVCRLPALCPGTLLPVDFTHTADLIEQATRATADWLESGRPEAASYYLGDFLS